MKSKTKKHKIKSSNKALLAAIEKMPKLVKKKAKVAKIKKKIRAIFLKAEKEIFKRD